MEKFMNFLEKHLMPIADKLNNNKYLSALRDAFMLTLPLIIFGSVFVVISNLPYLEKILGEGRLNQLKNLLGAASNATMSIMTLFVVFGFGYSLSKKYKVEPVYGAAVAVSAFLLLTPFTMQYGENAQDVVDGVIALDRLGAKGMFVGIISSIIAVEIYRIIVQKNWTIKMPAGVPDAVSRSFSSLIPAFITLTFFLAVRIIFTFTPWGNIHDFIYQSIQAPLMKLGSGLGATLIAIVFTQLLWFFGLHGQIIINSVFDPIWRALSLENLQAFQSGAEKLPHIVTKQFMDTFTVGMGGTGMTLAVIVGIIILAKSKQLKELSKLAGPAGIFNVNEPVIFGLPIVLNSAILIPWILAPMVVTAVTYFAMATGLVPPTTGVDVPWTVPIFFSGILATNSIAGGILQLVNLAIVLIIWMPFIIMIDRQYHKSEKEAEKNNLEVRANKNSKTITSN
ncbi:PTS cellobiose transporter subunit IIC [Clostridium colicanis]|uniref:Permease IIC component n=1 Tax=Clostridium colicanis DSM 13634 TaxID=1121305 RepID=A0A151AKZ5_9CLOT|nr:PTS cellobiose transporter subunit IIC [Clostridium colicanis]KYH28324.1 oligo-beta-mannoside permease IIC component [Clostridium colicanis DSM 13634]